MLFDTPQITWHGGESGKNDPVMSVDVHPLAVHDGQDEAYLLVTAGMDADVRIWLVKRPRGDDLTNGQTSWQERSATAQDFLTSLPGHQTSVNVVRFSPDGLSLASAADGGAVIVWSVSRPSRWAKKDLERDTRKTLLCCAAVDIYDLCWSPNGKRLLCGYVDGSARVWDVASKRVVAEVHDHTGYVQGVAWDPAGAFVATQSSDRSCRLYRCSEAGAGMFNLTKGGVIKAAAATPKSGEILCPTSMVTPVAESASTPVLVHESLEATLGQNAPLVTNPAGSKVASLDEMAAHADADDAAGTTVPESVSGGTAPLGEKEDVEIVDMTELSSQQDAAGQDSTGTGPAAGAAPSGVAPANTTPPPKKPLFAPDTVGTFFRRLSWLPDGSLLVCPSGQSTNEEDKTEKDANGRFSTFLFKRDKHGSPAASLGGLHRPSVGVRCCPTLFRSEAHPPTSLATGQRRNRASLALCDYPYRMVFAVASVDTLLVYDTQHRAPLAMASGLHYAQLTDSAWSADGRLLVFASADGYLTKCHFRSNELGEPLAAADVPMVTKRLHPLTYSTRGEAADIASASSSPKTGAVASVAAPIVIVDLETGAEGLERSSAAAAAAAAALALAAPGASGKMKDLVGPAADSADVVLLEPPPYAAAPSAGSAPSPKVLVPRPKMKIAPTQISPLPAPVVAGEGVPETVPGKSENTLLTTGEVVVVLESAAPMESDGGSRGSSGNDEQEERGAKRRITPTVLATLPAASGERGAESVSVPAHVELADSEEMEAVESVAKKKRITPVPVTAA